MYIYHRLTGSELVFAVLDELHESYVHGDEEFRNKLVEITTSVLAERPACMAVINILKSVMQRYLEQGLSGLDRFMAELRSSYDQALWRSAEVASRRINDGDRVLTNSNSLAVRRLFKILNDQGKTVKVYVTESRPGNEGLLVAEFAESLGFDVYLMVDSATRFFARDIDKVVVGAEAIAANGAVVSKIGTSLISLVAKEARKKVFVVAPSYKLSYETIYGELIPLPEKGADALVGTEELSKLPPNYKARVPLYDVTPPEYIDAIATEYGLYAPQAVPVLLRLVYGSYPPTTPTLEELMARIRGE